MYGAPYSNPPHKWDGRVANVLYMVSVGRYGWTAGNSGYYFEITSSSRTNPQGYGYGYWVTGYKSGGSNWFPGSINKGILIENKQYMPGGAYYTSTDYPGFKYCVNTHTPTANEGFISFTASGFDWKKDFCSKGISDTFETKISVYDPVIPLYEFLDNGEITVYFARCKNGYAYEAGAQGGENGIPSWQDVSSSGSNSTCRLVLDHAGTQTIKKDVLSMPDQTWQSLTFDVQVGDRLLLSCAGHKTTGLSGYYCIFWFSHDIPGWELADD